MWLIGTVTPESLVRASGNERGKGRETIQGVRLINRL